MCFSCCADGKVILWDIRSKEKIASLSGHQDGASCIDISSDGTTLWTGGLDSTVRSWDIRERREIDKYELQSQVSKMPKISIFSIFEHLNLYHFYFNISLF